MKAPWQITGPVSSPEFRDPIPDMLAYRTFSPATPAKRVFVPQSDPEHVYDIKYFVRDTRRDIRLPKVEAQDVKSQLQDPDLDRLKPSPSVYVMGKMVSIDELKNDGYQK
ncbi:hypothetical protein O6H91_Y560300 [Diphasiastrum complanatum]|nr:hypothetical protein O6H91_Y560300 [Diphasiastrum complanatum]